MDLCGRCGTNYSGYCNNCEAGSANTGPFINVTKNGCELCISTHFGSATVNISGCDVLTKLNVNEKGKLCYTDENGQTNCIDFCEILAGNSIKCLKDVDDECPPECTSLFGYRNGSYGQLLPEHIEEVTDEDEVGVRLENLVLTTDGCLKTDPGCDPTSNHANADCEDNQLEIDDLTFAYAGEFENNEGNYYSHTTWDSSYKNETDCCMILDIRLKGDYCYTFTEGAAYNALLRVSLITDSEVLGEQAITALSETTYPASIGHEAGPSAPPFISRPFERTWRVKLCPGETFDYKFAQVAVDNAGSLTGIDSTNGSYLGPGAPVAQLPTITVIETFECSCENGECTDGCVPDPDVDCGLGTPIEHTPGDTEGGEEGEG